MDVRKSGILYVIDNNKLNPLTSSSFFFYFICSRRICRYILALSVYIPAMEERASDPYCIACGGLVGFEDVYGSRSRRYLVDHDIELDPTNPLDWGGVYRAGLSPLLHPFML